MLNFSRMVGSRGFLSLYWSSTHSRAERLPSWYSHAFSGTPASVVRSSRVIVPRSLSARRMARFGSTSFRSWRSSGYGSADSNPMCRSSSFWPISAQWWKSRYRGRRGNSRSRSTAYSWR